MLVLNDLAKIAITWPFGHFCSRCLRKKFVQSLHVKCVLFRRQCHLRQCAFGPFKRGLLFRPFLTNFPWSPLCTFSENAGFGWHCLNCHNVAIRALLELPFARKSSQVFALYVHNNYRIMPFALECFWDFSARASFWAIFKKISLVPPLHFFRKCGFWVTLR